jgi:carotenoid cleavage dioxygenase
MSDAATTEAEKPFHLQGNFAPVSEEVTGENLEVIGSIPPELSGLYVRNSANPITGESEHWFMGNGMVHGVRLENGKASWYRNRYVQTTMLTSPDKPRISELGQIDHTVSSANTHVLRHGGKILALEEGSFPYVLDDNLETVGHTDFDGKLTGPFTAHPHVCPKTGEMLGFGYGQFPPYLTYHRVSPDGKLVQSEVIDVPGPTMMHDFMITESKALFMDLPVVFDLQAALAGTMPFSWSDDYGARIGIMPRTGTNADVKWFEIEPCYIFHAMNAHDEGNKVVYDACRMSEVWREAGQMTGGDTKLTLHRFTFDLDSGTVKEETLDDRGMEFPRVADSQVGQNNRYAFALAFDEGADSNDMSGFAGSVKIDHQTGARELHQHGPGRAPAEGTFVEAPGAENSDEGYLMTYVYDEATDGSELVIIDSTRFDKEPVARIKLPQRVPFGFHGSWNPDPA